MTETIDRSSLEAERDFLLRSIEDLDAERTAGELDDARYRELLDRYAARAATVLRALEEGHEPEPVTSPAPAGRRLAVAAGLVAVALLAGALLASSLGLRAPGATVTGNDQSAGGIRASFESKVQLRPEDADARLALARFLLQSGEPVDALPHYDEAARLDPSDAESRAYGGWILFLAGLTDEALSRLDAAVAADPAYPDAHFFRAMVLRDRGDEPGAAAELRTYLDLAPEGPLRSRVEAVLTELEGTAPPS